jgi:hypothetical protein
MRSLVCVRVSLTLMLNFWYVLICFLYILHAIKRTRPEESYTRFDDCSVLPEWFMSSMDGNQILTFVFCRKT